MRRLTIAASVAMTVLAIVDNPRETLPWLGVLAIGLPVYLVWVRLYPASANGARQNGASI